MGQESWARLARYRFPLYKAIHAEGVVLRASKELEPWDVSAPLMQEAA